jgi:hypothetical protein
MMRASCKQQQQASEDCISLRSLEMPVCLQPFCLVKADTFWCSPEHGGPFNQQQQS